MKKESDDESVKDAWDAESSDEEVEPAKAEPSPPVQEVKKSAPVEDKSKEVNLILLTLLIKCKTFFFMQLGWQTSIRII